MKVVKVFGMGFVGAITGILFLASMVYAADIFTVDDSGNVRLRISTSGNVGIGTTVDATSRLEVKGSGTTSATSALNVTDSAAASKLYVRDDGHVGVGTTSPTDELTVLGDVKISTNNPKPADYWSPYSFVGDTAGYLGTQGSAGLSVAWNGYRSNAGTNGFWRKYNAVGINDIDTVNSMEMKGGGIYFKSDSISDATTEFVPSIRLTIKDNGDITGTYGNYHVASDMRLKKEVVTIPNALDKVLKMRGVNFKWKDGSDNNTLQMGLIAQEVEHVIPEVVHTSNNKEKTKAIEYQYIVGILVEAIKQLKEENIQIKVQLESLNKKAVSQ